MERSRMPTAAQGTQQVLHQAHRHLVVCQGAEFTQGWLPADAAKTDTGDALLAWEAEASRKAHAACIIAARPLLDEGSELAMRKK
jgi:hypothetical protein